MNRIVGLGMMLAFTLVQVTWAPHLAVAGAFPNLVLIAVVAITWAYGVRAGLVWSCVGGVLLDLTASGAIGPHALALLAGAYATSLWARNLERPNALHVALTAALSTGLYSVVLVVVEGLLGMPSPGPGLVFRVALAMAIYNALLTPLAMEAMRRLASFLREAPEPN